jgi:hypothetical protein
MEEKFYEMTKDLPQLIVALDNEENYIHIKDAKDKIYRCPCCNGVVKPRAYKKDKEYKMQPHFYHINGSCDKESIAHWIYKNWLFKDGSEFYIDKVLYEVKEIEIEKSYNTKFGKYIPDITLITKDDKTFLFEINFTSEKKENDYFCKWQELNFDVVEVNIKEMLLSDFNESIPKFEMIYSNGVCFKKKYSERDEYIRTIDKIKREWSRQDKLNYKIEWERLDWFWIELCKYKNMKSTDKDVFEKFKLINFDNMVFCLDILHKHKLREIEEKCIKYKNSIFESKRRDNYILEQLSPRIYCICDLLKSNGFINLYKINKYKGVLEQEKDSNLLSKLNDFKFCSYDKEYIVNKYYETMYNNINDLNEKDIKINIYVLDKYFYVIKVFYNDEIIFNLTRRNIIEDDEYKYNYFCNQIKYSIENRKHILDKEKRLQKAKNEFSYVINETILKINNCKNKLWKIEYKKYKEYISYTIIFGGFYKYCGVYEYLGNINFKDKVYNDMKYLYYKKNGTETVERIFLEGDCK